MITFLPYADFELSASVLDWRRLGKQRVECLQLLKALRDPTNRHPACVMWRGFASALVEYGRAICDEWTSRGYEDSCRNKMAAYLDGPVVMPKWFGEPNFHASHRANLLRKDPDWYGMFGWKESPLLFYIWPRG